ncbi:hypothetical protein HP439_06715 [Sphingobacterium shayense]|uniref:DoxX family protein n=1 Tax=Sphingobacterium shayense TaxID=626343 RepID=UPI00155492A3|nr:hypothetical protein [Sphingobacterium shayense]NQD70407.1 hypothetical protein [Sphingobacterium shayense]
MPEIILPIVFFMSLFILMIMNKGLQYALSARIAMATMLVITGIAHFFYTEGMTMMLPDFIPYKRTIVYATGVIEIIAAIGMLLPKYQKFTGWFVILFFVLILPSNIYSAIQHVNMEAGTYDGEGLSYLWYRIPLQLVFIGWVYFSCINQISLRSNKFSSQR